VCLIVTAWWWHAMADDPTKLNPTILEPPEGSENGYGIKIINDGGQGQVIVRLSGLLGAYPKAQNHTIALFSNSQPSPDRKPSMVYEIPVYGLPTSQILKYDFGLHNYSLSYQVAGKRTAVSVAAPAAPIDLSPDVTLDDAVAAGVVPVSSSTAIEPDLKTMCAYAELSHALKSSATLANTVILTLIGATTDSLHIKFFLLSATKPKTFGHWIGVYRGIVGASNTRPPLGKAPVENDFSEDDMKIEGLNLKGSYQYSVVYYMRPEASANATSTAAGGALYFSLPD
jgi:hypothetical protein